MKQKSWIWILVGVAVMTAGCSSPPAGLKPVSGFEMERYLGTWYEIARLDHPFERGLDNVTASYYLRPDGNISVLNRGFNPKTGVWQTARGVAKFKSDSATGALKVSFFKPFWADYYIIDLDTWNYTWAIVTSSSRSYFWILSRTPTLDPMIREELVKQAKDWGFETAQMIFPSHENLN